MVSYLNPFASIEQESYYYDKTIDDVHVEVGSSNRIVDGIRNVISIPIKILLWNSNVNSGNVSEETIQKMKEYLDENNLHDVHVSVNQYKPQEVWRRTFSNPKTSFLSKMTVGIGTILTETLWIPKLTGFSGIPKLTGLGDRYDPPSNTIYLFSNDPAIALHKCGQAKDFNSKMNPTLYLLAADLPLVGPVVRIVQESIGNHNACDYLSTKNERGLLAHCFKILVPAYATYLAAALLQAPTFEDCLAIGRCNSGLLEYCDKETPTVFKTFMLGSLAILLVGHAMGRLLAANVEKETEDQTEKAPLETVS